MKYWFKRFANKKINLTHYNYFGIGFVYCLPVLHRTLQKLMLPDLVTETSNLIYEEKC